MHYEEMNEAQKAAHQAIGEIVADSGPAFAIEALADALYSEGQTAVGHYGDNLSQAVMILRQLAEVLDTDNNTEAG